MRRGERESVTHACIVDVGGCKCFDQQVVVAPLMVLPGMAVYGGMRQRKFEERKDDEVGVIFLMQMWQQAQSK